MGHFFGVLFRYSVQKYLISYHRYYCIVFFLHKFQAQVSVFFFAVYVVNVYSGGGGICVENQREQITNVADIDRDTVFISPLPSYAI